MHTDSELSIAPSEMNHNEPMTDGVEHGAGKSRPTDRSEYHVTFNLEDITSVETKKYQSTPRRQSMRVKEINDRKSMEAASKPQVVVREPRRRSVSSTRKRKSTRTPSRKRASVTPASKRSRSRSVASTGRKRTPARRSKA
jgi:hypothetical protein